MATTPGTSGGSTPKGSGAASTTPPTAGGVVNRLMKTGSNGSGLRAGEFGSDDPSLPERAADRVQRAGESVERGGRRVEKAGKRIEKAGKGLDKGGKALEKGGQTLDKGGKTLDVASKPVAEAGKATTKAGAGASKTLVGAIAGIPMMLGGSAVTTAGYGGQAAGKGAQGTGKGMQVGGRLSQAVGKGTQAAGKAGQSAGKAGQAAGDSVAGVAQKGKQAASALGTSRGRWRTFDKVDPVNRSAEAVDSVTGVPLAKGALKTGEVASRGIGGYVGGALGLAVGAAFAGKGALPGFLLGAKVGATGGRIAYRASLSAVGIIALVLLLIVPLLGGAGDILVAPTAIADERGSEEVPESWLDAYQQAAYPHLVPWPVLAGIGEVTSAHGTIDPYTLEEIENDPLLDGLDIPIEPDGDQSGGYGPLLLSAAVVDEHLGGNTDAAQDPAAAMGALAAAMNQFVVEAWYGDACLDALEARDLDSADLEQLEADDELPEECQEGEATEEPAEPENVDEPVEDVDDPEAAPDDSAADIDVSDEVDDFLLRHAAFDRRVLGGVPAAVLGEDETSADVHDEVAEAVWAAHVDVWFDVVSEADLITPTGNELCLASTQNLTSTQIIELELRCAPGSSDLEVARPGSNGDIEVLEPAQGVERLIVEAVHVAWVYNEWGGAEECDSDSTQGGMFPVTIPPPPEPEDEDEFVPPPPDRCNDAENIEQAVSILVERESQPFDSRPGTNDRERAMHGWAGIPGALGSDLNQARFVDDGVETSGEWSSAAECGPALEGFFALAFTRDAQLDEGWVDISVRWPVEETQELLNGLSDVPGWATVEASCDPLYDFDAERDATVPDAGWSRAFVDAFEDFDADGSLLPLLPEEVQRFVGLHRLGDAIERTDPVWGTTSSVPQLANPPIRDAAPSWTPLGSTQIAADVIRAALEYVGEDASRFFMLGGVNAAGLIAAGVPAEAAEVYMTVFQRMSEFAPECQLRVELVAAVGMVESNHGNINGGQFDPATGNVVTPEGRGIVGPALDGSGAGDNFTVYWDTNDGVYDYDTTYDRAVGPMQFLPSTFFGYSENRGGDPNRPKPTIDTSSDGPGYGRDFSGNGVRDPHNYFDAVGAAMMLLCEAGEGLGTRDLESQALFSYNNSQSYVDGVLEEADRIGAIAAQAGYSLVGGGAPGDLMATVEWAASTMPGVPYSQCYRSHDPPCGPGNRYGYNLGTNDPHFDCSGLVARVYKEYGVQLPALDTNSMVDQLDNDGSQLSQTLVARRNTGDTPISEAMLQPGDVLLYRGHTGMYIGNGQVLEARSIARGTEITSYAGVGWGSRATHVFRPSMLPKSDNIPETWPV